MFFKPLCLVFRHIEIGCIEVASCDYLNDPKFSDRYVCANSSDPDHTAPRGAVLLLEEQSDQGLHCLLFHLHHFDKIPSRFGLFV